jgi:hypothetical protein
VKWIGRRRFKRAGSDWPKDFMPVCVSRFALDERTPHADLYLSAAHSLFIDGVLIPVGHLINGATIMHALPTPTDEIEYFHIELETHEVIFAEGTPVETYLVTNGREGFDNFIEYERLYGSDPRPAIIPYAPIVSYNGGRSEMKALLRRVATSIVDVRNPIQVAFDRIAARSRELVS